MKRYLRIIIPVAAAFALFASILAYRTVQADKRMAKFQVQFEAWQQATASEARGEHPAPTADARLTELLTNLANGGLTAEHRAAATRMLLEWKLRGAHLDIVVLTPDDKALRFVVNGNPVNSETNSHIAAIRITDATADGLAWVSKIVNASGPASDRRLLTRIEPNGRPAAYVYLAAN